jgi:hypothetical protein
VTRSIIAGTPSLSDLRSDLVTRLAVLRVQAPRLFLAVVADPHVLVVLERLYRNRLAFSEEVLATKFGQDAGRRLFHTIAPHYQRTPQLQPLFATASFEEEEARLSEYLTLFGGPEA